jgi:streptogramin lyase
MRRARNWAILGLVLVPLLGFTWLRTPHQARAQAQTAVMPGLLGGPRGIVRASEGTPLEGIMVQLISLKNSIRTTVYTNEFGKYEFPKLADGDYVLRIPRPLEYQRYEKDSVRIEGATQLDDIVLKRVTDSQFLPPTPDILPQLTGAELIANLPGTLFEKKAFLDSCGGSCHGFQNQFRARFSEEDWRKIVHRMVDYSGRLIVDPIPNTGGTHPFKTKIHAGLELKSYEVESVVKWLSRVRGLEAENPPMRAFPRPQGRATRAIVTEYELPWLGVDIHDVTGDAEGNIWFTLNRSPFIGKLDPRTGKVTAYRTPTEPGKFPGNHWIQVDKSGIVWYSDTWAGNLVQFDPRTEKFHIAHTGVQGNMGLSPDGTVWRTNRYNIDMFDPETGKVIKQYPLHLIPSTYGNFLSWDGRYFGGGGNEGIVYLDTKTGKVREIPAPPGSNFHGRGSFDPEGNIWVGSKFGTLVKYDPQTNLVSEYVSPTPFVNFYEARADKNGDVWAGELHGGRIARFNPRTLQWTEYVLPTVWSFDWKSWIDNSTDPVKFWYGDQYGYIVSVQPLD